MNKNKRNALYKIAFIGFFLSLFFTNCSDPNKQFQTNTTESTNSSSTQVSGNPEIGKDFSGKVVGSLDSVSNSGKVWGYALDPNNKTKSLRVYFYIDGPVGTGILIGDTLANIQSLGANAGHYYSFTIPTQYADAKNRKLYAYGYAASASFSLTPNYLSFIAFTPKAEAIYNQGLNNLVTSTCNKCHSWSFRDLFYGPLMTPSPFSGGSPTNNTFYNKMMGHGGGKFCTVSTDFPCSDIQKWWNAEFN